MEIPPKVCKTCGQLFSSETELKVHKTLHEPYNLVVAANRGVSVSRLNRYQVDMWNTDPRFQVSDVISAESMSQAISKAIKEYHSSNKRLITKIVINLY